MDVGLTSKGGCFSKTSGLCRRTSETDGSATAALYLTRRASLLLAMLLSLGLWAALWAAVASVAAALMR